ncbi:VOC family protein [Enterobacter hormaechei]|jgi:catechol 2,3-dioxygenase-like lactoylglutathione lyase family enzyme|uniref:VOC family protein n=1 Tax=Enterobacter hormaechei TaxID=158836 RepID=UPI0017DAA7C3|nr:VOC family protein [Enterobacter hormaechei]EDR7340073.1 hypothetical protein [Salmonella enterica subsp. salamae]HCM9330087.1 VOC family protein [Enterobacter hormaechei subsp. steigerwaltii]EKS6391557.1 VOC family protein [Enterobacter hormaechei]ELT6674560.1 VOC family protein [Enterobacter hormaechei]ELT6677715.1 VOC family protein [Enterobacter hormaechei]
MLQSLNHLTLAVSNLQTSLTFWRDLLGLHVGDLSSRLAQCREKPYSGMRFGSEK